MRFTGYEGAYTFASRFESGMGTNPEELVGAAHAGCFSMYLSLLLTGEGLNPASIDTTAQVTIANDDSGPHITTITLQCNVKCDGLDEAKLKELAATTKEKCPISLVCRRHGQDHCRNRTLELIEPWKRKQNLN